MTSQASSSDNGSRLRWLVLGLGAVTLSLAACTGAVSGGGEATATATTTPAVPTVAPTAEVETESAPATAESTDAASGDANVIVVAADYDADSGTIEVRSIVTNLIAEGTCTVTATSPEGEELTATVDARPDAQSTVCPLATIEGVTGEGWKVQVAFESAEGNGISEAVVAEVRQ